MTDDGATYVAGLSAVEPGGLRAVQIGDSIVGFGNFTPTAGLAIAASGRTVTITQTSHGAFPGSLICVGNVDQDEFNGPQTVATRIDANSFTYELTRDPSAPPTGASLRVTHGYRVQDRNFFEYMNAALGHPFDIVFNAGIGGDVVADVLARLDRDALAFSPDVVLVCVGINDVHADRSAADVIAALRAIAAKINAAGALCLLCTLPPVDSNYANYTATRAQTARNINAAIRQWCHGNPGAICIDLNAALTDPTSATGNFAANLTTDYLHQDPRGAAAIGAAAAVQLAGRFMRSPYWPTTIADVYGTDPASLELNDNPLMQGTNGTASGSITTGGAGTGVPTGYTLTETGSGSAVVDPVSRADGFGNDLRMVMTSAADDDRLILTRTSQFSARAVAGKRYVFGANVRASGLTAFKYLSMLFNFTIDGVTYNVSACNTGAGNAWASDFDLWLRTQPIVMPAAPTSMNLQIAPRWAGVGGGTIHVGRVTMRQLVD